MKIRRHSHIPEETECDVQIKLSILTTSIDEKVDREDGLCVSSEVPRESKGKVWIRCDRVLYAFPSKFTSDGEIIFSTPEAVAVFYKLRYRFKLFF